MQESQPKRWGIDERFPILWHHWGDSYAVYHTGSGQTHILDDLAAQLLKLLVSEPANLAELASRFAEAVSLEADDELYLYMENALQEFERLELVAQDKP
jgi:PqqD family protein of HPr-rel-A system